MKVYIGYYCTFDGVNDRQYIEKVFDDEVKALIWVDLYNKQEGVNLDHAWREYEEMEVE